MNPAFAGSRNALAIDLATRQQWIGVEGAPMTYYASAHLPINETMMSAGVSLQSDKAGPVMANEFSLSYAYLLRINGNHLLDRKSTRLNSSHVRISYAVFCLKKKKKKTKILKTIKKQIKLQ